jgi:hypothetical protein
VVALSIDSGFVGAQPPDPRLEKVFADWQNRRTRTKAVLYRLRGESVQPKGCFTGQLDGYPPSKEIPPRDLVYPIKWTLLLDFATNRHRLETEEQEYDVSTDRLYPTVWTRIFDGEVLKSFRPRERNTHPLSGMGPTNADVAIGKGHIGMGAAFKTNYWPLFVGHGIVPWQEGPIIPGKLKVQPDIEMVSVHGQGVHQGRPCLVLRTHALQRAFTAFDEFWVDPARDSAVVRQILMTNGIAFIEFDIEYQKTARGWLPRNWTTTQRDFNKGKTVFLQRMRVEELTLEPPLRDADFQIEEKPGMLVTHLTYSAPLAGQGWAETPEPTTSHYRLGENGSRYQVVFVDGEERRLGYSRWWWTAALLVLAGLSGWLIHRWKQARRTVTTSSTG